MKLNVALLNQFLCFGIALLVSVAACADDETSKRDSETRFKPQIDARGGEVKAVATDSGLVLEIRSPRGIGRATIIRRNATWPMVTKVRLHLRGLEGFQATVDGDGIGVSVSSSAAEQSIRAHAIKQGRESTQLKPGGDGWPETKVVAKQKRIPLRDGYIEITLPASLFQGNPEQLSLQWIDFYR